MAARSAACRSVPSGALPSASAERDTGASSVAGWALTTVQRTSSRHEASHRTRRMLFLLTGRGRVRGHSDADRLSLFLLRTITGREQHGDVAHLHRVQAAVASLTDFPPEGPTGARSFSLETADLHVRTVVLDLG